MKRVRSVKAAAPGADAAVMAGGAVLVAAAVTAAEVVAVAVEDAAAAVTVVAEEAAAIANSRRWVFFQLRRAGRPFAPVCIFAVRNKRKTPARKSRRSPYVPAPKPGVSAFPLL